MNKTTNDLNNKELVFEIADNLSLARREWIETKLKHQPGIEFVAFSEDLPCYLTVIYKTASFSFITLLDLIQSYDVNAMPV
jgi:hypothetical protein